LSNFLGQRGLLTDGGSLNLARGLRGRGGVLSLTTQDVRASAHGLARDLLEEPNPARWAPLAEAYYGRYDRGKPRRPTRLQRLFLEWSPDLGPLGMLEACQTHHRLWQAVGDALPFQDPEDRERQLLEVALAVRESSSWDFWRQAFDSKASWRPDLLAMLPLLPQPPLQQRLAWLAGQAKEPRQLWSEGLLLACRRPPGSVPVDLPSPLRELLLQLVTTSPREVDGRWLGLLRGYRCGADYLEKLAGSLHVEDPIHRIVYGARPGRSWLAELWHDLRQVANLEAGNFGG
jgi:hypothetical protein